MIPEPVIAVVAEVLSDKYTHTKLNNLFMSAGAPGEPPPGNKVDKCTIWLLETSKSTEIDPLKVLGNLLEMFMEEEISSYGSYQDSIEQKRETIKRVLEKYGLNYVQGGYIVKIGGSCTIRSFSDIVRGRDIASVEHEFKRIIDNIDADPPSGLTASCALIESLLKIYIEDEGLAMPNKQEVKQLWNVVARHIGFDSSRIEDVDLHKIITGMASIVDGLGSFRTHAGSAHGRGRLKYKVEPRHARLAAHSAFTLAAFVLETWDKRKL